MNREIKFEIIYEDLKEKVHKQIVTLDNLLLGAWELPSDRLRVIARREFTGLKDKNGKEIYEGDILKRKTISGEWIILVEWKKWSYTGLLDVEEDGEVIGNIYENPTLLPDEKQ